ncbi:hypothetical protein CspHIS471_0308930 [Cutaneotrichosporon sp. HIS471]|nr:hypothetical protein CspHIS471_0308930 [Cutaneotrichosporon sp. HIS471]
MDARSHNSARPASPSPHPAMLIHNYVPAPNMPAEGSVAAPDPHRFKNYFFAAKAMIPLRHDSAPPIFPSIPRDSSPARPITPLAATPLAPTPLSSTPGNTGLSPHLSHRVDSVLAATPTAAESELVIGVRVTREIQGYFKRLLAAIREGGEFDELGPWILRAPMCKYSPEMPGCLRRVVLRLLDELVEERIRETEGYIDIIGGGWWAAERLVLSDIPCLIASTAMPGLTKVCSW